MKVMDFLPGPSDEPPVSGSSGGPAVAARVGGPADSATSGTGGRLLDAPWLRKNLLGTLGIVVLLLLWWAGTALFSAPGGFAERFSPAVALPALWGLAQAPDIWLHIAVSLKRVLVGLALSLVVGVPVGLLVGASRRVETVTSPAFQFLRMTSPLSWMPIAIMLFGIGDVPIYFLLAFAAVWPVMLNTASGVRQLDPHWLLLGRSLAATRAETLVHIVMPGILGHVLTGIRLAIGISWIVLVPCEMLGVQAGLGYFILDTRDRLAYPELMATVIVVGIIGFGLDYATRAIASRFSSAADSF